MTKLQKLPVIYYTEERIPNPHPAGDLSFREFHTVRNAIVRACRRHGPTGSFGELRLDKAELDFRTDWESGDKDPIYWVIDDQYNDELYHYMEFPRLGGFTAEWLQDIVETLAEFPGWGIGIGLTESYILIFADRIMVTGTAFEKCRTVEEVIQTYPLYDRFK